MKITSFLGLLVLLCVFGDLVTFGQARRFMNNGQGSDYYGGGGGIGGGNGGGGGGMAGVCPHYPVRVNCFASPCAFAQCGENQICCDDYSRGCNFHCVNKF